jgi:DNA-binding response OmpR family regulator
MEKKILIVDDESEIRHAISEILDENYTVFTASNGEEALYQFLMHEPEVIFLDFELGGYLRGNHILEIVKKGFPHVRVIMVTGRNDLKEKLLSSGADAFIGKPFDAMDIANALVC